METPNKIAEKMVDFLIPNSLEESIGIYKIIFDTAFCIMMKEPIKQEPRAKRDAHLLFQMTVLKCRSVLKLSEGFDKYISPVGNISLNPLFDSFSIYSIVRPQFEAFCNFNNIYLQSKNLDELNLKFNLWVLSGLNYRQSFNVRSEGNKQKKENEKKQAKEFNDAIEENRCFKQLDEKSKKNIYNAIERKEWRLEINGSSAKIISWHTLKKNAGIKLLDEHLYTQLSFASHPSNVSVFQFGEYAGRPDQCIMPIQTSCRFIAFLIRDFCIYFPKAKDIFKELPDHYKFIINTYNTAFRGNEYAL